MAMVLSIMGLSPPVTNECPDTDAYKTAVARRCGELVMQCLADNRRPLELMSRPAFINAARLVAATAGSTNAALHLLAMAAEAGTRLDLDDIDRAARSTPVIADLMPSGRYSAVEMFEAGGVAAVAAPLRAAGFLTDTPPVTGNRLFSELDRKSTRLNSS